MKIIAFISRARLPRMDRESSIKRTIILSTFFSTELDCFVRIGEYWYRFFMQVNKSAKKARSIILQCKPHSSSKTYSNSGESRRAPSL